MWTCICGSTLNHKKSIPRHKKKCSRYLEKSESTENYISNSFYGISDPKKIFLELLQKKVKLVTIKKIYLKEFLLLIVVILYTIIVRNVIQNFPYFTNRNF
jgi:hypothetical protein